MNISSQQLLNKRLPSVFGFIILFGTIGIITWISGNAILFGTRAATDNVPKNVQISNITDTGFTISYLTDDSVLGSIQFGASGQTAQVALDDRDTKAGTAKEYTIHYISVKQLNPSTKYTFTITSENENFSNSDAPYEVTTATQLTASSSATASSTLKGKIILDNGSSAPEAIVYVSSADSQLFSTIVQADGTYSLNLTNLRNKNLSGFVSLAPNDILTMQVVDATMTSEISLLASQTNPVPLITLSKNYDFAVSNDPLSPSPIASESATPTDEPPGFPITEGETGTTTPQILTPQEEQEFIDQQPLFRGKAVPNETVTITINSEQTITATVTADSNGNWQYRPNVPLEPGTHTITMRTIDASGLMRIITQSFVVYAEGSQFTEPSVSPSPSGTVTPTRTPTPTATPTPIQSGPTTQPTNTPAPTKAGTTATPTPSPTKTATPTKVVVATISPTTPPLPVSGNTSLMLTVIAIVTVTSIGALLFIFATV